MPVNASLRKIQTLTKEKKHDPEDYELNEFQSQYNETNYVEESGEDEGGEVMTASSDNKTSSDDEPPLKYSRFERNRDLE